MCATGAAELRRDVGLGSRSRRPLFSSFNELHPSTRQHYVTNIFSLSPDTHCILSTVLWCHSGCRKVIDQRTRSTTRSLCKTHRVVFRWPGRIVVQQY